MGVSKNGRFTALFVAVSMEKVVINLWLFSDKPASWAGQPRWGLEVWLWASKYPDDCCRITSLRRKELHWTFAWVFFPLWLEVKRPVLLNRNVLWLEVSLQWALITNYHLQGPSFSSTTMCIYIYIYLSLLLSLLLLSLLLLYYYYY